MKSKNVILMTKSKFWRVMALAFNLGLSIALPIAGGAVLGMILDKRFNTHPQMTLSLLFAGVFVAGGAIYSIIKETKEG